MICDVVQTGTGTLRALMRIHPQFPPGHVSMALSSQDSGRPPSTSRVQLQSPRSFFCFCCLPQILPPHGSILGQMNRKKMSRLFLAIGRWPAPCHSWGDLSYIPLSQKQKKKNAVWPPLPLGSGLLVPGWPSSDRLPTEVQEVLSGGRGRPEADGHLSQTTLKASFSWLLTISLSLG